MEHNIKIDESFLKKCEFDIDDIFGNWINNSHLKEKYQNALPISHVIIPNFLNTEFAEKIYNEFPDKPDHTWHKYYNPIEVKYANDRINDMEEHIRSLFYYLSTDKMIQIFSEISGISLQYDPYLHGAGLHMHPRNGRLGLHLDYEKHPITGKERRMNIILYLSKDWKDEYNGATELWDKNVSQCVVSSPVRFNTAIVFQTNDISYHGLPEKIVCPENIYRKTLAYYYVSELESKSSEHKFGATENGYRLKASFVKRPQDPDLEPMKMLYDIRPHRRINNDDMKCIWNEWTPELF